MNLTPDAATITDAALRYQYDDLTTIDDLEQFALAFADDDAIITDLRTELIEMIDLDLNDMLHNNNLDFYLTLDEINELDEQQFIALANHLDETIDTAAIADALIARATA